MLHSDIYIWATFEYFQYVVRAGFDIPWFFQHEVNL